MFQQGPGRCDSRGRDCNRTLPLFWQFSFCDFILQILSQNLTKRKEQGYVLVNTSIINCRRMHHFMQWTQLYLYICPLFFKSPSDLGPHRALSRVLCDKWSSLVTCFILGKCVYVNPNPFACSSVDGHLGCLHILTTVDSATVNSGMHISFGIMVFSGYMPQSRIAVNVRLDAIKLLEENIGRTFFDINHSEHYSRIPPS